MRRLGGILLLCLLLSAGTFAPAAGFSEEAVGLAGYRICIDPGHQARLDDRHEPLAPWRTDTKARVAGGAQGVKTYRRESEVNLEMALLLRDALEKEGAEVLLVRQEQEVRISNVQRAQMANQFQADVFLRLHCNASDNPSRRGICIYAPKRAAALYYDVEEAQMLAWAQSLADLMREATGAPSAKAAVNDVYSGSNWAQMPTFLVEMGYMTNEADDLLLATEAYQQGLVAGMIAFIKTMPRDAYRDHPIMNSPVMENHRSTTERIVVREAPDAAAEVIATVGARYRVFVLDALEDGWYQVMTYQKGQVGYTDCATLEPCR